MSSWGADPGVASSSCLGPLCQQLEQGSIPHMEKMGTAGGVPTGEGFKPWSRTRTSLVTGAHGKQGDPVSGTSRNLRGGRFQVSQKVQAGRQSQGQLPGWDFLTLGSNTWALAWRPLKGAGAGGFVCNSFNNISLACAHTRSATDLGGLLASYVMSLYLSSSPGNCHLARVLSGGGKASRESVERKAGNSSFCLTAFGQRES